MAGKGSRSRNCPFGVIVRSVTLKSDHGLKPTNHSPVMFQCLKDILMADGGLFFVCLFVCLLFLLLFVCLLFWRCFLLFSLVCLLFSFALRGRVLRCKRF